MDSQWSKQESCFACATWVWLAFNHNTSITSSEWVRCSKRIAQASELGSCQSNFVKFMRLWTVAKPKDSLKDCFENVNIYMWGHGMYHMGSKLIVPCWLIFHDKRLSLIRSQTVWHSEGIPERNFWKSWFRKKVSRLQKKHAKLPSRQRGKNVDPSLPSSWKMAIIID